VTVFVDTSVWYAAARLHDADNARAKELLKAGADFVTSTFVLNETWRLLQLRLNWQGAERFWSTIRSGVAGLEPITPADLEAAWFIGQRYADQEFSMTDRTSFAVMERLGIRKAASFDSDFSIYRFGKRNSEAFEVLR
jgi:uncharacterized protein